MSVHSISAAPSAGSAGRRATARPKSARAATFVPGLTDARHHGGSSPAYCAVMGAPTRRVIAALRRPGPARDLAVAAATALGGIALVFGYPRKFGHLPGMPWWVLVGVQLVSAACLLSRRRAPLTV